MRRIIAVSAMLLMVLSFASAYARSRPDWVDGASKKYPQPQFFIGVGAVPMGKGGRKQQMDWAGDAARAEIAKSIKSEVKVTTRSQRTVGGPKAGSTQTDVVQATSRQVLEGVEVKKYYRDKRERMLYALAVLDRYKAAKNLEKRAQRIKQDIVSEVDAAGEMKDGKRYLNALSHYDRALAMATEITEIEDLINILKPSASLSLMEAPYHESTLREAIRRVKKLIRFRVAIEGPAAKVRGYAIRGLSKAGYFTGGGANAYELKGTTDVTYKGTIDMGEDMTMQIFQADLDMEVIDKASGETVGALTWSASANEKSRAMAEKSAVRALGRYVERSIAEKLGNIL